MKCWKCGQQVVEGASVCPYCGAAMARPAPATETGRSMRMLYDRYGAQEVLTNSAYLANGLADLVDGSKTLRSQLRMALDAGLGKAYLAQLGTGAPDAAFYGRVKLILTEDAGLSGKAAGALAGYFDEMIGWRSAPAPERPPRKEPEPEVKKAPGWNEIDRTGRYKTPPAPRPQPQRTAPPALEARSFMRQANGPYESVRIWLRRDTDQIMSMEYTASYHTSPAAAQRVRAGLEAAGRALHFGTVAVQLLGPDTVAYSQELDFTYVMRAEAQEFVPLVRLDRQAKTEVFQLKFSRTAGRFAKFLEKEGFK